MSVPVFARTHSVNEVESERAHWLEVAVVAGIAAVPAVGSSMSVVTQAVFDRRRSRVAELGDAVLADHDRTLIVERLRDDERFGELFVRTCESTALESWLPKRQAMALVVRAVIDGDDAELDEGELLIAALETLTAPHFAALQRLEDACKDLEPNIVGVYFQTVPGLTPAVLGALVATGAVEAQSGWGEAGMGGIFHRPTEFGRRLLALVLI